MRSEFQDLTQFRVALDPGGSRGVHVNICQWMNFLHGFSFTSTLHRGIIVFEEKYAHILRLISNHSTEGQLGNSIGSFLDHQQRLELRQVKTREALLSSGLIRIPQREWGCAIKTGILKQIQQLISPDYGDDAQRSPELQVKASDVLTLYLLHCDQLMSAALNKEKVQSVLGTAGPKPRFLAGTEVLLSKGFRGIFDAYALVWSRNVYEVGIRVGKNVYTVIVYT